MTTAVATLSQAHSFPALLKQHQAEIARALPRHLNPDRMTRIALTEFRKNPKLGECDPRSVFAAVIMASQLGLEPGLMGQCYLIPYRSECQLIPGYQGLLDLVRRSGKVKRIEAQVVYERDRFTYRTGLFVTLEHEPLLDGDRGEPRLAYAVAEFADGGHHVEIMTRAQIEAIRDRGSNSQNAKKYGKKTPWDTDTDEMWRKGLALDTPIPTPSGWITMGEISVGDVVFDHLGKPTPVTDVSEIKNIPCFRVTFSNGDFVVCDDEHRWLARAGGANACKDQYRVYTVNELFAAKNQGLAVTIPVQGALDLPDADLPINPYLLGYWLGDGTARRPQITCNTDDLQHVEDAISEAYTLGTVRKDERADAWCVGIKGMLEDLRSLDLISNKHIPQIYLRASIDQRKQLLAGLIDSDGHVDKDRGRVKYTSTNYALACGVFELASSLGETPLQICRRVSGFGVETTSHEVSWQPSFVCATLPRKKERIRDRKISIYRAIKSIEEVPSVPTRCIAVASAEKTYLCGRSMAPTHNTVLRRLCKFLPKSVELMTALSLDDAAGQGQKLNVREVIEGNWAPPPVADEEPLPPIAIIATTPEPPAEMNPETGEIPEPTQAAPEPELPPADPCGDLLMLIGEAQTTADLDALSRDIGRLRNGERSRCIAAWKARKSDLSKAA